MIEVEIDSIRISLVTQHRIVMLREADGERQMAIWIGPCEAEAITNELQDTEIPRPMTHDLLRNLVEELGAAISHIHINELREGVFFAKMNLDVNGEAVEIDCRPSDAIALAVRSKSPIFVADEVIDEAGVVPEPDISRAEDGEDESDLDAFKDFVDTLDFDDFDD